MVEATREFLLGLFQYLRYMGFFLAETGKHESVEMALEMPSCFCVCATVLQVLPPGQGGKGVHEISLSVLSYNCSPLKIQTLFF